MRGWREHLHALNAAGFDVPSYDRRGEGLSGGFSDTNTLEQSEDIFRVLEQMETGQGMRMLTPRGQVLEGMQAAGKPMAGQRARQIPLILGGYSRGSMTTGWAMAKNYVESCSYDLPTVTCTPAKDYTNIKGAILMASFVSGAGYLPDALDLADRNLFLGGMAADNYVVFYPVCCAEAWTAGLQPSSGKGCGTAPKVSRGPSPLMTVSTASRRSS